jgi:propionyl-CoA synthetase
MPKGVIRTLAGMAVATRYSIEHVFGLTSKDTMFCASDLGWVVGHVYILQGPLLLGASTVIFEGKREKLGTFSVHSCD